MDSVAAATSHKFASAQEIFGCYDIDLFLDERGMTGNCPSFHRQRSRRMQIGSFLVTRDDPDNYSIVFEGSPLLSAEDISKLLLKWPFCSYEP